MKQQIVNYCEGRNLFRLQKHMQDNYFVLHVCNKFEVLRHSTFYFRATFRSEGSIAIVKKFDLDFFMIFGYTSLPQSKNVFRKNVCVCVCVTVADRRA